MIKTATKYKTRKNNDAPAAAVTPDTEAPASVDAEAHREEGQGIEEGADAAPVPATAYEATASSVAESHDRETMATATEISPSAAKTSTKLDAVIAMLRRDNGATVAEMVAATNWQPHSVRGFLSGTVKKKYGLTLDKTKAANGELTYRIVPDPVDQELDEMLTAAPAGSPQAVATNAASEANLESSNEPAASADAEPGEYNSQQEPAAPTSDKASEPETTNPEASATQENGEA